MADKRSPELISFSSVVSEIQTLMDRARAGAARHVNQELLTAYWKIGEVIVRYEQNDQIRAAYGEKTLLQLSRVLTREIGKGFSRSNVYNMRQFYLDYPKFQTVSGKLSWSHYCELMILSDRDKRSFTKGNVSDPDGRSESLSGRSTALCLKDCCFPKAM